MQWPGRRRLGRRRPRPLRALSCIQRQGCRFRLSYAKSCLPGFCWQTPRPPPAFPPDEPTLLPCPVRRLQCFLCPRSRGETSPALPCPAHGFSHHAGPAAPRACSRPRSFRPVCFVRVLFLLDLGGQGSPTSLQRRPPSNRQGMGFTAGETRMWSVFLRARPPLPCD